MFPKVTKTIRQPPSDPSGGRVGIRKYRRFPFYPGCLLNIFSDALMENISTTQTTTDSDMQGAFADLSALMSKAQDMVRLAKDLNEQLTAATARNPNAEVIEPEEATFVRSSLAQLGLSMKNAPVTADMSRDERRFMEQLAKELAGVLLADGGDGGSAERGNKPNAAGLMKSRGIIGLDEVWGGWNRARGVCK